ncbi:hypothetical protein LTR86_010269 [Recurvomyces mirabilis]|nr:hypothetical protein LTR86_010269 [Recurvomyces mirabilis]
MPCFTFLVILAAALGACARQLDVDSSDNTISSAQVLAAKLMTYYNGASILPQPYWWWETAGSLATMVQYSHNTQDYQYDDQVASIIASQAGSAGDFMGPSTLGNDDQLWWATLCMTAAEYGFRQPDSGPQYLQLAQNVYNEVSTRWDNSTCNGGLRWQIASSAPGYNYKNAISNGLFFQLAARLGRYTGDSSYLDQAKRSWDWVASIGMIDSASYNVYDGSDDTLQCKSLDHDQWSYNSAAFLYGAAMMADATGDTSTWQPRLTGLLTSITKTFTINSILQEPCETKPEGCNTDQLSFKAYTARWLAATAALGPSTAAQIQPILTASARGALPSCNDGTEGTCGARWTTNAFDGSEGVGQQMSALEIVQAGLLGGRPLPGKMVARTVAMRFWA